TALQAFPGAALEARLVAMRLVGPSASVERGSGRSLHTVLQEIGQDHRLVLVALNDLVSRRLPGTGEAPTSYLDVAKNVKESTTTIQRLLYGAGTATAGVSTARAATVGATAAGTTAMAGTVAGGEAAGAGAATVATATVAAALTAVVVV